MSWVWDHSPYSGASLLMHLALADWANDDGECWPNQPQIAAKMRSSIETVRRLTRKMEEDGWLVIVEPSPGKGRSHRYQLALSAPSRDVLTPADTASPTDCGASPVTPTTGSGYPHIDAGFPPHRSPDNRQEPSVEQPSNTLAILANLTAPDLDTEMFNVFWDVYPRHTGGRPPARKAWDNAIKRTDPQVIVDGALRFREDPNRLDEFTPHPSTWLNQNRWADDPLPARGASTRQSGTATFVKAFGWQGCPLIELDW